MMLSLTYEAARTALTRRFSHRSLPMLDSYPRPVVAQASWPNASKRKRSTGTPASTWHPPSSKPRVDQATTLKSSSKHSTAAPTTHLRPPATPRPSSRPTCTTASPNNNSEPSPRDHHAYWLTHVTPNFHSLSPSHTHVWKTLWPYVAHAASVHTRLFVLANSQVSATFSPFAVFQVFSHVCPANATG